MYFRRSLNRVAKDKSLVSSIRLGTRYCHTGCVRPFPLSKCDEFRKAKNFTFFLSTLRNFSSEYLKKNSGIDTKAPEFRSYNWTVKSSNKNRKETSGNFHTKAPKSLTLKMCKQPSKNVSTYQPIGSHVKTDHSNEKATDEKENDILAIMASKAEICRIICNPNVSIPSTEPISTTSSKSESTERIIDKLTDAEIEEICKTKCPCKKCHESTTTTSKSSQSVGTKKHKNETSSSWYIKQSADYEDPSTTAKARSHVRKNRIDERSSRTRVMISENTDPSMDTTNTAKNVNKNRIDERSSERINFRQQHSMTNDHPQQPFPIYPASDQFDSRKANKFQPLPPSVPYKSKDQLMSKYRRMVRTKTRPSSKTIAFKIQPRPQPIIHPIGMNLGIQPSNFNYINPNIGFNPQIFQVTPAPFGFRPINKKIETKQVFGNHYPRFGYKNVSVPYKSLSHFKQLNPEPQLKPIYDKRYYPKPVSGKHFPRFDYKLLRIPYKSGHKHLIRTRPRTNQIAPVYGTQNRKNRKSLFDLQSIVPNRLMNQQLNLPKWTVHRTKLANDIVNKNKNATNIGGRNVTASSIPNHLLNMDLDKIKTQFVDLPTGILSSDTNMQSKKIDFKLIENQSIIIDGPQKFKLVTSSFPQLRNDKDVIIQMEYVNLIDADMFHYLTGKYNLYSYATTTLGRIGSGTIIDIGKEVNNVKIGDKVFIKPVSCGKCSLCSSDRRNLCEYVTASEKQPPEGTLSRLHVHPSEFITKIPDNVSLLNAAAVTWTLSCAIRACQKAEISAGDTVVVIGAGPLGTATALAAMSMGATTVCLSDTRESALDEAQKAGVKSLFLIDPKSPSENTAIKIWEHIGEYPRLTFDCRGSQFTNQIAIAATKTGGKVIVMSNMGNDSIVPISNVITRDIDIIVSTIGNDESELAALRYLSTGKLSINNITCNHYDLSNVQEAFLHMLSPRRLDSQIVIQCFTKHDEQDKKEKEENK